MHPVMAFVGCMDSRLPDKQLFGDSRGISYIVRTPGSVLSDSILDGLQLVVEKKHLRLVVFTVHDDCAAEKAGKDFAA